MASSATAQRDGGAGGDQVGRVVGRARVVAAQRGDDVGDGLAGEALVDPVPLGQQRTRRRLDGVRGQRGVDAVGDDGLL